MAFYTSQDISWEIKAHLRKTKHTHNPLDDAKGNAEDFLEMSKKYGLKIDLS